jgi:hypothetical protein
MLLGMQTCLKRCRFTEKKEAAQFEAKLRQGDEQGIGHGGRGLR